MFDISSIPFEFEVKIIKINFIDYKLIPVYFFMIVTALDGLVIPTLIAGIVNAVENKSFQSLVFFFIFGILGYFLIRTALYFWSTTQQKYIKSFNINYKNKIIKRYMLGNNISKKMML